MCARAARNQSLFRSVNEELKNIGPRGGGSEPISFVCECLNSACAERRFFCLELIYIPPADYKTARVTNGFMLCPGHDDPQVEHVIADFGRYIVVETLR